MSTKNHGKSSGPGWPVVATREDLEAHDPHAPAYVLVPPAMVEPVWLWIDRLHAPSDLGECSRAIEKLLICLFEQDGQGIASALNDLKETAWRAFDVGLRFEFHGEGTGWAARLREPVPQPEAEPEERPGSHLEGSPKYSPAPSSAAASVWQ